MRWSQILAVRQFSTDVTVSYSPNIAAKGEGELTFTITLQTEEVCPPSCPGCPALTDSALHTNEA